MNPRIVSALAIAGLTIPTLSTAALGPIVVTASRFEEPKKDAVAPITVIDRRDIEQSNAESLEGLLQRSVPGLQFTQNGGQGTTASVFMRGTNSDHVLVLVDGVRHGSATTGTASFQYIPPNQIERIEVVRGPRSSLYGSEAIGGVIQIFTRKGEPGFRTHAEATAGSNDTFEANAGISGGNQDTRYSISGGRFRTEGIDAERGNNPDADGYDNTNASFTVDHHFTSDIQAGLSAMRAEGASEYDGTLAGSDYETDFVQQTVSAHMDVTATKIWDFSVRGGESRDESDNLTDGTRSSFFDTRREQLSWKNDVALSATQQLVLGADYVEDEVDSSTDYDETSRTNEGLFGQWLLDLGTDQLRLGLRRDDNEAFGEHTTGNIDWRHQLSPNLHVLAAYGTAFKAPTFNELYYPGFGNPDLEPEESESFEVGLEGRGVTSQWEVRAFRTEITDLIQFDFFAGGYTPSNVDAVIDGLELSADTTLSGWRVRPSITFLDPRNDRTGNQLRRRAKRKLTLDVQRAWDAWGMGATLTARSARYDDADNTERMGGYALLDLRASYRPAPSWTVQGKLNNTFDKDYETVEGYNTLGRRFMLTVRYRSGG